jgi:hypothetical protein
VSEIRATLDEKGYALWALRKYQERTGKADRPALEYIVERWAMLEPHAEAYGITLDHFSGERALATVTPIGKKKDGAAG